MIKRFPPAGRWPIAALQVKWCRESLAQSGSHATEVWTSCTRPQWWSLILHVGRVFPHAVQEPFLWIKVELRPGSTQSAPLLSRLASLLSLLLFSCRSWSTLPQFYMKTHFGALSVWRAHPISCRHVTMVSIICDAWGTLFSPIMKHKLFQVGFLDLHFQCLHLRVLCSRLNWYIFSMCLLSSKQTYLRQLN